MLILGLLSKDLDMVIFINYENNVMFVFFFVFSFIEDREKLLCDLYCSLYLLMVIVYLFLLFIIDFFWFLYVVIIIIGILINYGGDLWKFGILDLFK